MTNRNSGKPVEMIRRLLPETNERECYASASYTLGEQQRQLDLKIISRRPMVDDVERWIDLLFASVPDVIRIHDVHCPFRKRIPEVIGIALLTQWWVACVNSSVGLVETLPRQVQVQESHFGKYR